MSRVKKVPSPTAPDAALTPVLVAANAPLTKSATVLAHLQREHGATLAELVAATGWQPHTTRAMLTGLRKKGHAIERRVRGDVSCYHLPVADA
jgi:DNA-binding MarR family transcriptional regulator